MRDGTSPFSHTRTLYRRGMELYADGRPYLIRYLAAWIPLVAAYLIVFMISSPGHWGWTLATALTNVTTPIVLGAVVFAVVCLFVLRAHLLVQLAAHIALSVAFSALWLRALSWQLGAISWLRTGTWEVVTFQGAAQTWQLFQGLVVYFMILAGIYAINLHVRGSYLLAGLVTPASGSSQSMSDPERQTGPQRVFLKSDGAYVPLDFQDVIAISGADDYCEVHTALGATLVRMTLAEMESRLTPAHFIRVHRSHLINIERVVSVRSRPGGGLNIELQTGLVVPASRAGAASLQPFLVT